VEIKPSKIESWSALSKIYDDLGKSDLAIEALEKVLEINPNISGAKRILERLRKTQGVASKQ
ncbi:MAG: tetratricopeptide repeat protein, partial [Candidatus Thorarchaeota archaeon]|nr:tetratricopeptide repeat protein [Candidatus Thorarchaeota archaeon]